MNINRMNMIYQELFVNVEIKFSSYNKDIFQKNFKHFLRNLGYFYEGNYDMIKPNEPAI
jgi:hypothetical protein